jgi:hypothetical protein
MTTTTGAFRQEQIIIGTTAGNAIGKMGLDFAARVLIVDNFSNQFVFIPQAQTWVPPNTQGWQVRFGDVGQRFAEANIATTPSGAAQAATVAGQVIVLTWYEKEQPSVAVTQQITAVANTTIDGAGIMVAGTPAAEVAADAIAVAAAAGLRYLGFSAKETAGAPATAVIRHGNIGGPIIDHINLAAGETAREWYGPDGIATPNNIFFDLLTGAMTVTVRSKTVA